MRCLPKGHLGRIAVRGKEIFFGKNKKRDFNKRGDIFIDGSHVSLPALFFFGTEGGSAAGFGGGEYSPRNGL